MISCNTPYQCPVNASMIISYQYILSTHLTTILILTQLTHLLPVILLHQNISRLTMNICGGKASTFTSSESRSPFELWAKSAMKDKTRPCAVYMDVIPLYAVLPPDSIVRSQLASAVVEHIYKIRHSVAFNITYAPMVISPHPRLYTTSHQKYQIHLSYHIHYLRFVSDFSVS